MLNFQTDYDEATGEQVLTCFLLPQMEYQIENQGKQNVQFNVFDFWYYDFHILQILFTWVECLVLSVSSFRTEAEKIIWVTVLQIHF